MKEFHPVADLLPLLQGAAFEGLAADIKTASSTGTGAAGEDDGNRGDKAKGRLTDLVADVQPRRRRRSSGEAARLPQVPGLRAGSLVK
jgi:hypothetical protein